MATQKYALKRGEEKKLVITWDMGWTNTQIEFNGKKVGTIETRKELQIGQTFTLPDKSNLEVKYKNSILSSGLALTRDGVPIPDSVNDPMSALRGNWQIAHVVAVYNILIGFLFLILKFDTPYLPNFGYITLLLGVGYLVLARMLKKLSQPALIAFLVLFTIETLLEAVTNYSFFVLFRAAIIYYMFQGFGAFKNLRAVESEQAPMISE